MQSSTPDAAVTPTDLLTADARALAVARRIVSGCRVRLEWLCRLPVLETVLADGVRELELPGPRQGIGLRAALDSLAIEHKFSLLRWALPHLRRLFPSCWMPRLRQDWGITGPGMLELDEHLSSSQWDEVRSQLLAELAREQRRYKQAQGALFHAHRGLVHLVVQRQVFCAGKRADAEQEGCLALLAAIDRIEDSDASFEAYAQQWVSRAVRNFLLRERLPVYAPVNLVSRALRQDEAATRALPEGALEPVVALDASLPDGDSPGALLADDQAAAPDAEADRADLRALVRGCLARLTDKQREVLELRYGLGGTAPLTIQEIARRIGISHQQVSMREKRALESLVGHLEPVAAERRA